MPSLRAVVAPAFLVVVLAGCAAGDAAPADGPSPTDPVTVPTASSVGTTTPAPVTPSAQPVAFGLDWRQLEPSGPLDADGAYHSFSGGGTLWVLDTKKPTVLHGTDDGVTWRELDLVEHGLPADAKLRPGTSGCSASPLAADRGDGFTMVYYTFYKGSHPDGLLDQFWLVDVDGSEVSVTSAADNGLEKMPPPAGGDSFRTSCVAGMGTVGGSRVIVGEGQWWQPYKTGSADAFTAFEDENGRWRVHSRKSSKFFGGNYQLRTRGVHTVGGRLVVLASSDSPDVAFEVWGSSDAKAWKRVKVPGERVDPSTMQVAVADSGIAVFATADSLDGATGGAVNLWTSPDGQAWTRTLLHEGVAGGGPKADVEVLAARPDGGFVVGTSTWDGEKSGALAWESPDGQAWESVEVPEGSRLRAGAVPHAGGLVAVTGNGIYVSGLDWGGPDSPSATN